MRKYIRPIIGEGQTASHRVQTVIITVIAALAMLSGIGQRILDSHSNLGDADHLAALSLIMSGVPADATPVTFLDVDDKTRIAWGASGITPHAALAELIKQAVSNGAAAIMVDFDLSPVTIDQPADGSLASLLRDYPATAPDLMLVRKIHFVRATTPDQNNPLQAASASVTPYDDVARGKPNIRWVTTLNDIDRDRSVRRIKLWQTVCDGASGISYPSAALAVTAHPLDGRNRETELAAFLRNRVAVECGHEAGTKPSWPPVSDGVAQLPYVFADNPQSPALFRIVVNSQETVALRRISAGRLVSFENGVASAAGEVDRDPFANRAVILGASYTDSGDIYETPFGTMSGALVLANSVLQARTIVETSPASTFIKNLLAMLLFLLLAVIARYFNGAAAIIVLGLVALAALFVVSRWFGFSTGIDVIAVAVPGFALFKLFDSIVFIILNVPKLGWRAVLKP